MLDHAAALWVMGCETTRTEWQPLDLRASRLGVRATATADGMVPSMPMMSTLLVSATALAAKPRPSTTTEVKRFQRIEPPILNLAPMSAHGAENTSAL